MEAMLGQSRRGVNPRSGQVTVQTQPPLAEQETNTTSAPHSPVFLDKAECVRSFSAKLEDDRIPVISGLAIDKEHMFVVDRRNFRTKVFTHEGQFKFDIKVNAPWDVAVSQTGHLYITSWGDRCVQVYSTRGQQVTTMGQGLLGSPRGITLNRQGHVMVCDGRKKSIFTFHADSGQLLNTIPLSMCEFPVYITVNSVNDNIVITDWGSDMRRYCVHVLSPTGDHLYQYNGSREGSELWYPHGVCTDSYGHIFIADSGKQRIVALSPQGQFIRYIVTWDDGLLFPSAVVINPAGQLVVGENKGNVKTFQYVELKQGEFNERLRRLCESGKIPVYRQRVAIVGPYGVGKTYLAKRLIHEEYIKEEDANTTGVNIYRHRFVVHKAGRSCWIRGKDDPKDQFAQNMAIGVQNSDTFCEPDLTVLDQTPLEESLPDSEENINNMLTNRAAPPDDSESPASPDKAAAAPPDDSESPASPDRAAVAERDHLDDIDKELLEKIEKIARGEDVEPEKQVTIWDFAGQDVYYTTHQTFLSERIIYLLVFRLDQDLDDKIRVYRGEKTLKEFIMFWLNSIHMHTIGKLREEDKNAMPYVLIIGTHKDMLCPQVKTLFLSQLFNYYHTYSMYNLYPFNHITLRFLMSDLIVPPA
ncbi:uncharacterized protein LOC106159696 [Lingula anatina]|uniref:Uncharacterized protein LOC106159696 n=1 Tax=Lingula anatina TaxID=7574 RepID=A0A2R2MK95_LINAN|nr:uncharacterized protein LOC106159696 [Lingula anatina]|eukprot:XP_023930482.1 uncharacterized protein LOC106159696 [Lingula anatina]